MRTQPWLQDNTNGNDSTESNSDKTKKEDVNSLFASYMAQRKDDVLNINSKSYNWRSSSSNVEDNSSSGGISSNNYDGSSRKSNSSSSNAQESESQKRSIASSIPGIRRFFGSASGTNTGSSSENQIVQHIPLGGGNEQPVVGNSNGPPKTTNEGNTKPPNPPSLLEQDLLRINVSYQNFHTQMKGQLEELRSQNPESVPDNADEILTKVIEEQKAYDVKEVKNQRALESFDEYYAKRMKESNQVDGFGMASGGNNAGVANNIYNQDPIVKEIVEEATKEQQFRMEQEEQYRKYQEYEKSLKKNAMYMSNNIVDNPSTTAAAGTSNKNFDEIQLEILQDLLEKRKQRSYAGDIEDEDLYVTDNIEDGIEELQEQMDNKEFDSNQYRPETLKEWQMYRAIATKLANAKATDEEEDDDDEIFKGFSSGGSEGRILFESLTVDDADVVRKKVQAWKEFQIKEEEMRKQAGLSIKYRLPFEWSDKPEPDQESMSPSKPKKPFDFEKAEKARSDLDQLALKVLHDLMMKTKDPARREKIRNEIEGLQQGIKARLEAIKNRGPITSRKKVSAPIDINAALGRGKKPAKVKKGEVFDNQGVQGSMRRQSDDDSLAGVDDDYDDDYFIEIDNVIDEEEPPDSPFFRELEEEKDLTVSNTSSGPSASEDSDDDDEVDINLGTMEEQKFRSMVARSGVRTIDGQNKLKQEWEEFQRAEQMMRDKIGLSGGTKAEEPNFKAKYDVNNIFKDGDIDADLILGTIGKRPSRKNRGNQSDTTGGNVDDMSPKEEVKSQNVILESPEPGINSDNIKTTKMVDIEPEPAKEIPQVVASPQRGSLGLGQELDPQKQYLSNTFSGFDARKASLLEYSVLSVAQLNTLMGLKRSVYSTGVSPYLARINKPFQEFGAIFMLEGALIDVTGLQYEAWKRTARTYDFPSPTLEDTKYASVHSEDYAIQKVFFWTDDISEMRKIVDTYREKRREVFQEWFKGNDAKPSDSDSIPPELGTSTSSDSADVESEVMNIQVVAWQNAAREFGCGPPTIDVVKIVGTMPPDEAVRAVFKWTNDFMISNNIAASYRKYLKEETSKWMARSTNIPPPRIADSSFNDTLEQRKSQSISSPTMQDYLQLKLKAWENVAQKHNFDPPALNDVNVAEFTGPEKAIQTVFKWTSVDEECKLILKSYKDILKNLTQAWMQKIDNQGIQNAISSAEEAVEEMPFVVLREGVEHWLSSIQEVFVPSVVISNMDEDIMNGILEQVGLSQFFSSDKRISSSTGYETATQKMLGAALRAERRPDHCIVFSATPQSAFSAHEVEMKNIALVSPYPYYELTTADMTVRDFRSIGMMNLKNVFSETGGEEPMQQLQVESPRVQRKTMLKTRYWDD